MAHPKVLITKDAAWYGKVPGSSLRTALEHGAGFAAISSKNENRCVRTDMFIAVLVPMMQGNRKNVGQKNLNMSCLVLLQLLNISKIAPTDVRF